MNIGRRAKFWHKNCVAIGMAAAFIEPLEASAIFLIEAAGNMLTDQFPRTRSAMELVEKKYNKSFDLRWEKSIEFIKMHYFLSRRNDSDFWLDNRRIESVPAGLLERLEHWKNHPPSKFDFENIFEPFPLESYQYILYGLNYPMLIQDYASTFPMVDYAKQQFKRTQELSKLAMSELPTHRDLLEKIQQYEFKTI
jgi:tryptophan 7-halogenase